jgi:hypothetical protein
MSEDIERRDRLRLVLAMFAVGGVLVAAIGVAGLGAGGLDLGKELQQPGNAPSGGGGGGGFGAGWLGDVLGGVADLAGGLGGFADDIARLLGNAPPPSQSGGSSGGAVPIDDIGELPFRPSPGLLSGLRNADFNVSEIPFDQFNGSFDQFNGSELFENRSVLKDGEYLIVFEDQPVPGEPTRVFVATSGGGAENVGIEINGEILARTNEQGVARVRIPYASKLQVNAVPPPDSAATRESAVSSRGFTATESESTARPSATRTLAGTAGRLSPVGIAAAQEAVPGGKGSVDLSGATTVRFVPELAPGADVRVQVLVHNEPVEGVDVAVDGTRVGRTDEDGRVDAKVPTERKMTLAVERETFAYEQTVTIVNVSVATVGPVGPVLPGQPMTVNVTVEDEPLAGATVGIEGAPDGSTGTDGTYQTELSWTPRATVSVETPRGVTIDRTLWPILPVAVGAILLVAVCALVAHVYGSERMNHVLDRLNQALSRAIGVLIALGTRGERAIAGVVRWLADRLERLGGRITLERVRALPGRLLAWLHHRLLDDEQTGEPTAEESTVEAETTVGPATTSSTESLTGSRARIRNAWASVQRRTPGRPHRTTPPGTIARRAVRAGLPREPVRTLVDAMRAVEFGETAPEEHVEDAERAAEALDAAEDDGSDHSEGDRS